VDELFLILTLRGEVLSSHKTRPPPIEVDHRTGEGAHALSELGFVMRYRFLLRREAISCLIRTSSSALLGDIAWREAIILSRLSRENVSRRADQSPQRERERERRGGTHLLILRWGHLPRERKEEEEEEEE